jgi:hypothetical protein
MSSDRMITSAKADCRACNLAGSLTGPPERQNFARYQPAKVRDNTGLGDYADPGWYDAPNGTVAAAIGSDPAFGNPALRKPS